MTSPSVVFMRGLSGSGKSTMAQELTKDGNYTRVNMDDIRRCLGLPFNPANEQLAVKMQDQVFLRCLQDGRNVVVDNLHLHPKWPQRLAYIAWENGFTPNYSICDLTMVSIDDCIARDAARPNGLGEQVIRKQAKELDKQRRRGLWNDHTITQHLPEIVPYIMSTVTADPGRTAIFDIDGTLALHRFRGPYDYEQLHTDDLARSVAAVFDGLRRDQCNILLVSGRDERYREETEQWLADWTLPHANLFMRPAGDQRRDSIVKLDLFNRHIRYNYYVTMVFDDRDRCVALWRALGLPTFQVAPGDF